LAAAAGSPAAAVEAGVGTGVGAGVGTDVGGAGVGGTNVVAGIDRDSEALSVRVWDVDAEGGWEGDREVEVASFVAAGVSSCGGAGV